MAKNKRIKKAVIITLLTIFSLIFLLFVFILSVFIQSYTYKIDAQLERIENKTGLIQAGEEDNSSRSLYDKDGKRIVLKGINAGNVLVQEGWLSCFSLGAKKDEHGEYLKDADRNLVYDEFTQEDFLTGLKSNPNFDDSKREELIKYYCEAVFNEGDVKAIKDNGFNCIRLPFYWRNILNDDYSRKEEDEAFSYLDTVLAHCQKHEIYLILDLHGAPQTQNGYEHSGTVAPNALLWDDEEALNATVDIWDYISEHYTKEKELGQLIASYDILNEPIINKGKFNEGTPKRAYKLYDDIYDRIRERGDNHLLTFEFLWDQSKMVNPKKYEWKNIMYEIHFYNWGNVPMPLFRAYFDLKKIGHDFDVPMLVGEFNFFDDEENWRFALDDWFDKRGFSWTIWNYKAAIIGDYNTNWGLVNARMNLNKDTCEEKCNVLTCTENEFIKFTDMLRLENCKYSNLQGIVGKYFSDLS